MANGNGNGGAPTDQTYYRQYLQSQAPDGTQTVREVVSPTLLDPDAAAAHEAAAGRTFAGFLTPDQMAAMNPQPAAAPTPAPPDTQGTLLPSAVAPPGMMPAAGPATASPSYYWNLVGPGAAGVGALAAPVIAGPLQALGVPYPVGVAAVNALASGGGQLVQSLGQGEDLGPALAKSGIAAEVGALGGPALEKVLPAAQGVMSGAMKYIGGRFGTVLEALEPLRPWLGGGQTVDSAANTINSLAANAGKAARGATTDLFNAQIVAAPPDLIVGTGGLTPSAARAMNTVATSGIFTPNEQAEFGGLMGRVVPGTPVPYAQLAGGERQLENWIATAQAKGAPAVAQTIQDLHGGVGTHLDTVANATTLDPVLGQTGLGPARAAYNAARAEQNAIRFGAATIQGAAPGVPTATAIARNPDAFQSMVDVATPEQAANLGKAWITTMRPAALATPDPVLTFGNAYDALGQQTRQTLFGEAAQPLGAVFRTAATNPDRAQQVADLITGGAGSGAVWSAMHGAWLPAAGLALRAAADPAGPVLAGEALRYPAVATAAGYALPAVRRGLIGGTMAGAQAVRQSLQGAPVWPSVTTGP